MDTKGLIITINSSGSAHVIIFMIFRVELWGDGLSRWSSLRHCTSGAISSSSPCPAVATFPHPSRFRRTADSILQMTHRAQSRHAWRSGGFFSLGSGPVMKIYSTLHDQCDPYVLFLSRSSFFRSRTRSTYNYMNDPYGLPSSVKKIESMRVIESPG